MNISSIVVTPEKGRIIAHRIIDKEKEPMVRIWARSMLAQYLEILEDEKPITLKDFNAAIHGFVEASKMIVIQMENNEDPNDGEEQC